MKLVTVEASIAADAIERALSAIEDQADIVRAMPGCIGSALKPLMTAPPVTTIASVDTL